MSEIPTLMASSFLAGSGFDQTRGTPPFHPTTAVSQNVRAVARQVGGPADPRLVMTEGLLDARASVVVTPELRSPHRIEPGLEGAASRRVPRPKARLADSRRAGGLREPPRAAKIWS